MEGNRCVTEFCIARSCVVFNSVMPLPPHSLRFQDRIAHRTIRAVVFVFHCDRGGVNNQKQLQTPRNDPSPSTRKIWWTMEHGRENDDGEGETFVLGGGVHVDRNVTWWWEVYIVEDGLGRKDKNIWKSINSVLLLLFLVFSFQLFWSIVVRSSRVPSRCLLFYFLTSWSPAAFLFGVFECPLVAVISWRMSFFFFLLFLLFHIKPTTTKKKLSFVTSSSRWLSVRRRLNYVRLQLIATTAFVQKFVFFRFFCFQWQIFFFVLG